jgi:hypothetical protein
MLDNCELESIVNFQGMAFRDAIVENTIIIIKKSKNKNKRNSNQVEISTFDNNFRRIKHKLIPQGQFVKNKNFTYNVHMDEISTTIRMKMEKGSRPLNEFLFVNQAIALKHSRESWVTMDKSQKNTKPLLVGGKNINRYSLEWDGSYLIYDLNGIHSCKTESIFLTKEKLIFRRVSKRLIATLDSEQFYGLHTLVVMNLKPNADIDLRYILAIFNSKLMTYYYRKVFASTKTIFSEIGARQVEQLPIRITSHDLEKNAIDLVDRMLFLNRKLKDMGGKLTDERERLVNEINQTDKNIENLVCKIYQLSDEEKEIIATERM